MSPKVDRATITLGPSRIKVEEEVLQIGDQGLIAATTPTTAPGDGGTTPVGPPGDLITPPGVDGVEGYPILNTDLTAITYAGLIASGNVSWSIVDGTSLGWFTRTLLLGVDATGTASGGTRAINLDNPSQYYQYASTMPPSDPVLRSGVLVAGAYAWSGTAWDLIPNQVITVPGGTVTVLMAFPSATVFDRAVTYSDANYIYAFVSCTYAIGASTGAGKALVRLAVSGAFNLELVAGPFTGGIYGINTITDRVIGVEAQYAYVDLRITSPSTSNYRIAVDITTNSVATVTSANTTLSPVVWALLDGSLATLAQTAVGGFHNLEIRFPDGSVLNQTTYMAAAVYTDVFGEGAKLLLRVPQASTLVAFFLEGATSINKGIQLTGQGYQTFSMPTDGISIGNSSPRWSPTGAGTELRWVGLPTVGTVSGLYEGSVA